MLQRAVRQWTEYHNSHWPKRCTRDNILGVSVQTHAVLNSLQEQGIEDVCIELLKVIYTNSLMTGHLHKESNKIILPPKVFTARINVRTVGHPVLHGSCLPTTYRFDVRRNWDAVSTQTLCYIHINIFLFDIQTPVSLSDPTKWRTWLVGVGRLAPRHSRWVKPELHRPFMCANRITL